MSKHAPKLHKGLSLFPRIGGVEILEDSKGRVHLNSLHQAAGCEPEHHPALWLQTRQAQELAAQARTKDKFSTVIKPNAPHTGGGIYVSRPLAEAYADWISAELGAQLRHAFGLPVNHPVSPLVANGDLSRIQILEMALEAEDTAIRLHSESVSLERPIRAADQIAYLGESMDLPSAADALDMTPGELLRRLRLLGWVSQRKGARNGEAESACQELVKGGMLEHKAVVEARPNGQEEARDRVLITPRGLAELKQRRAVAASMGKSF